VVKQFQIANRMTSHLRNDKNSVYHVKINEFKRWNTESPDTVTCLV